MKLETGSRKTVWKQLYSLRDQIVLVSVGLAAYAFSSLGDGVEALYQWTRTYEWFELDELLLTLSFLAPVGFALLIRRWYQLAHQMEQLAQAQRTVKQSEVRYRLLFEKAEEMNRLKSVFLNNISHEIRTPLTSVIGFAEILISETAGQHQEFAGFIEHNGRRLLTTLDAILDLARLEADNVEMQRETLNLRTELIRAAPPFQKAAHHKGLAFILEVPPDPVYATLDQTCLHRIMSHLLSNAIKFTDNGEIRLILKRQGNEAHIVVQDTGIGIDKAFQPHLFAAFKQESTGIARTHEGSGLGLNIAARLAEKIGARIEVISNKGEGSVFVIVVPSFEMKPTSRTVALSG